MRLVLALPSACLPESATLALLESGHVTASSRVLVTFDGVASSLPVLFVAVECVREQVVRALIRLGADIDAFGTFGAYVHSPAAHAISNGIVSGLALCHRLGANLSIVRRRTSPQRSDSALSMALGDTQSACLAYLLDSVYLARPVELSGRNDRFVPRFAPRWWREAPVPGAGDSLFQL